MSSIANEVKALINKFDKNRDYQLDWEEVYDNFKATGSKDPITATFTLFKSLDKNGDDVISIKEIIHSKMEQKAKECEKVIKNDVDTLLYKYDSNNDNKITWDEVVEALSKDKNEKDQKFRAHLLFKQIDTDGDKVITVDEIREHSKRIHQFYPNQ